jgi:hypothetical protein
VSRASARSPRPHQAEEARVDKRGAEGRALNGPKRRRSRMPGAGFKKILKLSRKAETKALLPA